MLIPLWTLGILVLVCCVFVGLATYYFKKTTCLLEENAELHRKLGVQNSMKPTRDTQRASDALYRELGILLQPYTALELDCLNNTTFVLFHRKGKRDLVRLVVNNSVTQGGKPLCMVHYLDSREVGGECVKSILTTEVGAELMPLLSKFQRVSAAHQLQTLAYDRS